MWTIPNNSRHLKSVVRTIAISRPPYKSRVGAIPIVRDSIQNQLSGQLQFIENLRKLVVQTMPTGTNLRNQLPLQFKVIAHWLCFVKCSLMIQKRPTYKHIIIPKVDLSRPFLLMCEASAFSRRGRCYRDDLPVPEALRRSLMADRAEQCFFLGLVRKC